MNFCPQCGSPIEPGARFCGNCGLNISASGQRPVFLTIGE
jgi:predicted nucleic acid-binding Zn ribbon protein